MHLYQNIDEEQFSQHQLSGKYKSVLFNLSFFHTILVGRKKYKNFGWNDVYNFNDSDFQVKYIIN